MHFQLYTFELCSNYISIHSHITVQCSSAHSLSEMRLENNLQDKTGQSNTQLVRTDNEPSTGVTEGGGLN